MKHEKKEGGLLIHKPQESVHKPLIDEMRRMKRKSHVLSPPPLFPSPL
jgi:hypothetical protein